MAIGKDFWEQHHRDDSGWLTGTGFENLLTAFGLVEHDIAGKQVLEIGVGKATCSTGLARLASDLYCCDISETALSKVKDLARQTYLSPDIIHIPPVDLAVSHLVFVHCSDDEMLRIINGVNLAEGGRFIFQISGLKDNILTEKVQQELVNDGSHFFRGVEQTKDIIACSNKQLVSVTDPVPGNPFADWLDHEWYYVTVQNKI
jgi:SAM-dependent methyltransferase